jgi:hypothetical protein
VTADWPNGIPIAEAGASVQLYFKATADDHILWSVVGDDVLLTNALTINGSE